MKLSRYTGPEERFWLRVQKGDQCWPWIGELKPNGYAEIRVDNRRVYAHRYSFFLAHGEWPTGIVLHSCDNRRCVNPDHLRDGTYRENAADAIARGRHTKGEAHGHAKLTTEAVRVIRRDSARGVSHESLAERFGVTKRAVALVVERKNWAHVEDDGI